MNFLNQLIVIGVFMLLSSCSNRQQVEISKKDITHSYKLNSQKELGNNFVDLFLEQQFMENVKENSSWEDLDKHYRNIVDLQKDNQKLGFFKIKVMQILFVEGSTSRRNLVFVYENTKKHQSVIEYYANEILSLNIQNPIVVKNLSNYLKLFWGEERLKNYLSGIAKTNKQYYLYIKNNDINNNFIKNNKVSDDLKMQMSNRHEKMKIAIDYILKH